jgi:DNA-directed RNA polymerase subunit M/transcription elongation factor TFIIS
MAMRNCDRCFENFWDYKHIEDTIIATCKMCGYEVQFLDRKHKKRKYPQKKRPNNKWTRPQRELTKVFSGIRPKGLGLPGY